MVENSLIKLARVFLPLLNATLKISDTEDNLLRLLNVQRLHVTPHFDLHILDQMTDIYEVRFDFSYGCCLLALASQATGQVGHAAANER